MEWLKELYDSYGGLLVLLLFSILGPLLRWFRQRSRRYLMGPEGEAEELLPSPPVLSKSQGEEFPDAAALPFEAFDENKQAFISEQALAESDAWPLPVGDVDEEFVLDADESRQSAGVDAKSLQSLLYEGAPTLRNAFLVGELLAPRHGMAPNRGL